MQPRSAPGVALERSGLPSAPLSAMPPLRLALFALLAAISPLSRAETRPNIVWIVSEDNGALHNALYDPNGARTPHLEQLASEGLLFTHAFSNAPVCSVARSAIISGCYGPRTATNHHRATQKMPLPDGLRMFPTYLRQAGYYTTNNAKQDYNFDLDPEAWDASSKKASWKDRAPGQPFFHVQNFEVTHESRTHPKMAELN